MLKTLGERILVNNLLEYLYTAKILSYEFLYLKGQNCNFLILANLR